MDLKPDTAIVEIPIDRVFIGSCTNARLEDLKDAAEIVKGKTVNSDVNAMVVTGSQMVKLEADALEHSEDLLVEAARANPRLHQMPALKPIDEDFVFNSTAEDLSQKQKRKKSMELRD